jgi:hypothetical protein
VPHDDDFDCENDAPDGVKPVNEIDIEVRDEDDDDVFRAASINKSLTAFNAISPPAVSDVPPTRWISWPATSVMLPPASSEDYSSNIFVSICLQSSGERPVL